MGLSGLSFAYFQYVPRKTGHRWNCLHRFHSSMPEEVRGTSILSPAIKQFRDLADYVDYELVGALIAARFTVFVETPVDMLNSNGGFGGEAATMDYGPQIQPGTMTVGQAGHKPHIISSARPGPTFDAFYERALRATARQHRPALRNGGQGFFEDQLQQRPGGPAGSLEAALSVSGLVHPRLPGRAVVGYALKILPYLALRSAELRGGRWSEIDLDKALWIVPAARRENIKDGGGMKMRILDVIPRLSRGGS